MYQEKTGDLPLVSVVVITYNSAKYVIETLESIKNQTYPNIELVISDDYSQDDTLPICSKWLAQNSVCFQGTRIVTADKNTGVAGNCNRGLEAANGEWVKLIAGDDILFKDGVYAYVTYVLDNPLAKVVISDLEFFGKKTGRFVVNEGINNMPVSLQLKRFLLNSKDGVPSMGPSGFYEKKTMVSVGGYETAYPLIEDYPTTLRLLDSGIKVYALGHVCVRYRINSGSISTAHAFSSKFIEMYETCAVPILKRRKMYFVLYEFYVSRLIGQYHSGLLGVKILRYILKATSPYAWIEYLRCRKNKKTAGS